MVNPEDGNIQMVRRRRRTRRHRRNRLIRRWLTLAAVAVSTASISTLALMYFSPSLFRERQSAPSTSLRRDLDTDRVVTVDQVLPQAQPSRLVYPYSVVPGGVEDARELKWVAEHDPVVAAHYAGFDYAHARIVRVVLARTAYVSYRIGNHIYWTRRRIALHKGEKLITDGRMTARGRCANRVEETPQQEASPVEPPAQRFDQPVRAGDGTATKAPPVAFESALLNRPAAPGLGPMGPLSLYDPFVGGSLVAIASPPLPAGLCSPVKKKGSEDDGGMDIGGKKKKVGPCGTGGSTGVVPEPGTWVLFASGLAAIYWRARCQIHRA